MQDINIGEFIKSRRKELGMTQQDLADKCGFSQPTVARFENGFHRPNLDSMILLAEALAVPLDELVRMKSDGQ